MTSSAWKRIVGGMVRSMALAVLRLMISSNLVACSTARSAIRPSRVSISAGSDSTMSASAPSRVIARTSAVYFVLMAQLHDVQVHPQRLGCHRQVMRPRRMVWGGGIRQHGDACALG